MNSNISKWKRISIEDAIDYVTNGNESDIADLDSDTDNEDDSDCEIHGVDNNLLGEMAGDEIVSSEEEDCLPEISTVQPSKNSGDKHEYRWRKKDLPETCSIFQLPVEEFEDCSPLEYFKMFWTGELCDTIVEQTNLYSFQKSTHCINVNKEELEKFIGIHLMMGIIKLPSYKMYWSNNIRYAPVADTMPLKRFERIRRYLHFVDNSTYNPTVVDKLFKIRPVVESVRLQCIKIVPEESHSVDEQIIPTKTKYSRIRQYNPRKPKKWGFKNLVRAGSSGIMYDFYIYSGKDDHVESVSDFSHLQKSAQVVAHLCQHLPVHSGHKLYFDNWFTTMDLLMYLRNKGILSCGTVRSNRLKGCPLASNKELAKMGRGAVDYKSDINSGILVAKWYDNNAVHIASNFLGIEPMGSVERWCPKSKEKKAIPCPKLILGYNKGMGGVDLADMLISLYRIPMKTKRWYITIFWHMVDIAKVNAWLLYRRHCDITKTPKKKRLSLLQFITDIAEALLGANKVAVQKSSAAPGRPKRRSSTEGSTSVSKAGRKAAIPMPCNEVRFDLLDHWPLPAKEKRGRCRYCKDGYSQIYCSKCKVCLCLRDGHNCFYDYHKK